MKPNLDTLKTFTEDSLPDLDTVVLGALEYLEGETLPEIKFGGFKKPLVVGSGNALATGRALFEDTHALFRDESTFLDAFLTHPDIDAVCVISASGGKHATKIVQESIERDLPTFLLTNTKEAFAAIHLDPSCVTVFPKIREPYTYNVSTYMSMLLADSKEDPAAIKAFIEAEVAPKIPQVLACYDAFFFLVPPRFDAMRELFRTKFDELFGPELQGRMFTIEQAKHAKTVVSSSSEYFISLGEENTIFGTEANRLAIPLPSAPGPAAVMAIGYFIIGRIQKQFPSYFKDNIKNYAAEAAQLFGHAIPVIVE